MTSTLRVPPAIQVGGAGPDWYLAAERRHPSRRFRDADPEPEELLALVSVGKRLAGDGPPPEHERGRDLARMSFEMSALTGFFSVGYVVDRLTGAFLAAAVAWLVSRRLGR